MQTLIPIDVVRTAAELARAECERQGGSPSGYARRAMGVHHCISDIESTNVGDAWFAGRIMWCINHFRERRWSLEMHGAMYLLDAMAATPGINTTYFKAHAQGLRRGMGLL